MADGSDSLLLGKYADENSEAAFAELVQRHINLVYSVAFRYTGNAADAQDVTQVVFTILAEKAGGLRQRTILTGWLYEATCLTSRQLLRTRARQQARDQKAYMQSILDQSSDDALWHQLAPHLEAAMLRLSGRDRELLALRFYEKKTAAEVAALLGIGIEAAHKRTHRALEKLQNIFAKRGINSTAAVIAGAISTHSIQVAPVALTKAVTTAAIAKGTTASISTSTLIKGALKIMAWTKAKTAITAGVVVLLATGTATTLVIVKHERPNRSTTSLVRKISPGDFAPAKVAFMTEMGSVKMTVIPALMQYAKEHDDNIPASMADLRPYLPPDTNGINYDNWEILATGKFTPQLGQRNTVLLRQKQVPPGQYHGMRIVGYTDGHLEASRN